MNKKLIINIALVIVACVLGYLVVDSIRQPIIFTETLNKRQDGTWNADTKEINNKNGEFEVCVKQSLIDIRDAQILYRQRYNQFTDNFDTLIAFVKNDSLPIIIREHDAADSTYTKTIDKIVGYTKVADSLFGKRKNFSIDNMCYIPFSKDNAVKFEMEAGFINSGNVKVPVLEVRAPFETYLWDLDQQRVRNLKAEIEEKNKNITNPKMIKYPGRKLGSLEEASLNGNWESL